MKGGNFAKKYVVKLIQERWFLNFTFHKGTCIVRGTLFSVKLLQRDFPLP